MATTFRMTQAERHRWYITALALSFVFIAVALTVTLAPQYVTEGDTGVIALFMPFRAMPWLGIFLAITFLGSPAGVLLAGIVTTYFLRKHPEFPIRLAAALVLGTACVEFLKSVFSRARPESLSWLITEPSFSFPSGHSTASMTLYAFLAFVIIRYERGTALKIMTALFAAVIIALVGMSRIILGVHYPSDVLGGYALGGFWACIAVAMPVWPVGRRLFSRR